MKYFILDVFAEKKFAGNQLAVVILDKNISSDEMQNIANEFHFSETTFIDTAKSDKGFNVRIFTPKNEVPFAGHPVLGTAFIIKNEIIKSNVEQIILNLKAGQIPVTVEKQGANDLLWMKQLEPVFGKNFKPEHIAEMINVTIDDINKNFPIQEVSTGLPFIIIPLKTLNAVKKASTNLVYYNNYFKKDSEKPLFIFCPETYENNNINCRMFADILGIPEDPATGSANGCLAGYLVKYEYFKDNHINIKVEQGYEIGRNSLLYLKASFENNKFDINVGGKVIKIAEGNLL